MERITVNTDTLVEGDEDAFCGREEFSVDLDDHDIKRIVEALTTHLPTSIDIQEWDVHGFEWCDEYEDCYLDTGWIGTELSINSNGKCFLGLCTNYAAIEYDEDGDRLDSDDLDWDNTYYVGFDVTKIIHALVATKMAPHWRYTINMQ